MACGSRVTRRLGVLFAMVVLGAGSFGGLLTPGPAGAAPPALYYVALGDSLAYGLGASPNSSSYVNQLYQHELARIPGLQLQNLSCPGATTASMISGSNCGRPITQLADAEAFLAAHHGQIAFVTIDIGANDIDGCVTGGTIDQTCIDDGIAAIAANIPQILSGLSTAYPGIDIFGMNYYDPFLAAWLTGPSGQTQAQQSVTQADAFNALLHNLYAASGVPTADVATRFQTDDFSLTGTYQAITEPQNVANICNWTHMCAVGDIHANNTGHAVLAHAFEPLIDAAIKAPGAPTSPGASSGDTRMGLKWTAPANTGGLPLTGYVVTPYIGPTAQPARVLNPAVTGAVITGLTNGTIYTFRVAAKNAIGTGPSSAPTAPIRVGTPTPPFGATASAGTGQAALHWARPLSDSGSPITGYVVTPFYLGVAQTQRVFNGTAQSAVVTGLVSGYAYTFTVAARNGVGVGARSLPSNAVVPS